MIIIMDIDRSKLPEHTQDQFMEWINFVTCNNDDQISVDNPLYDCDLHDYVVKGSLKFQ